MREGQRDDPFHRRPGGEQPRPTHCCIVSREKRANKQVSDQVRPWADKQINIYAMQCLSPSPHTERIHRRLDVLDGVIDRKCFRLVSKLFPRFRRSCRVDVQVYGLFGVLVLQVEELGEDQLSHRRNERRSKVDDPFFEQVRRKVGRRLGAGITAGRGKNLRGRRKKTEKKRKKKSMHRQADLSSAR